MSDIKKCATCANTAPYWQLEDGRCVKCWRESARVIADTLIGDWIPVSKSPEESKDYLVFGPDPRGHCVAEYDVRMGMWRFDRYLIFPCFWRPLPPLPAKPDDFKAWWSKQPRAEGMEDHRFVPSVDGDLMAPVNQQVARTIWDIAKAAQKRGE